MPIDRGARGLLFLCYAGLGLLAVYYAWSVQRGAGGARLWSLGIGNIGLAVYELLGFAGLGPGRIELREAGREGLMHVVRVLSDYLLPLGLLSVFLAAAGFLSLRLKRGIGREVFSLCLAVSFLGFLLLTGAAAAAKWPFWGRHLAPLLPFIVLTIATACTNTNAPRWAARAVLIGIATCWLASSLSLRLLPRHANDAYREAASFARSALEAGRTVWWAADEATGSYYDVPLSNNGSVGTARFVFAPYPSDLTNAGMPDAIVLSRPDQFDERGAIREWLSKHGYVRTNSWVAFTTWEHPR